MGWDPYIPGSSHPWRHVTVSVYRSRRWQNLSAAFATFWKKVTWTQSQARPTPKTLTMPSTHNAEKHWDTDDIDKWKVRLRRIRALSAQD